MDILAMIKLCISTVAYNVLMPGNNTSYFILIMIVYSQYRKTAALQEAVYGRVKTPLKNLMASSILSGLVTGIAVSIPMTLIGISFNQNMGIIYLIPLSILLMLIEPRFLCFSYSGGLLSIISIIFGLKWIDVTGIMVLVAILHLLEAVLIYIDGSRGAVPVFYRRKDGNVVGGYTMQHFWPIPLALIIFMGYGPVSGEVIHTPQWWPLLRPYIDPTLIEQAVFTAMPVCAVLGYSEFTSSYLPEEKCKNSSLKLGLFSIILLVLSVISSYIYIFKIIAAVFAPAAHEYLIQHQKRLEYSRESIFSPASDGIKVLDTIPDGPAESMNIKPGDTILSVNNIAVMDENALEEFFKEYKSYIWVEIRDRNGRVRTEEFRDYQHGIDSLGILSVPREIEGLLTIREKDSFIKRLFKRFSKGSE